MKTRTFPLRFFLLLMAVSVAWLCLSPMDAQADIVKTATIDDHTDVFPYFRGSPSTGYGYTWWTDIIAPDPANWDIHRVVATWTFKMTSGRLDAGASTVTLEIHTNYPLFGGQGGTADIRLVNKIDGAVTGILLHGQSFEAGTHSFTTQMFSEVTWASSQTATAPHQWSNGGYVYGGVYAHRPPFGAYPDPLAGNLPYVYMSHYQKALGDVQITQLPGSDTSYLIQVVFALNIGGGALWHNFDFTVMSGTCANDTLAGNADPHLPTDVIPLPPSVFLLGTGLLGLYCLGRRHLRI